VIDANQNVIDERTNELVLTGNARISDGLVLLNADEIRYNQQTNLATATGHIVFTRGEVRLLADRLVYNRATGAFEAQNIRLGSHPYFIEGFSAAGTRDEITVKRARASYGEPGLWQPTINADTLTLLPNKELRSENVTVGIGATQPFPIPRLDYSLGAPLIGTGSLNGGYRRSLGVFAEAALHVPVTAGVRLGADLGIFSNRGVMIGPSGRYSDSKDGDRLRGYFRSGYINDHGDKGTDNIFNQPVPENRAYAEWQHRQQLAPDLTLTAMGNWWKDPEVYRDFRSRAFFPVQEPDTFAEGVYTSDNYIVSAFTRLQPNRFHRVQERLPEIRFDLLPYALANGFYHRFNASFAMLREDPLLTGPAAAALALSNPAFAPFVQLETSRLDAYYALERPVVHRDWLALTPIIGGRLTHYTRSRIGGTALPNYFRLLSEVGMDAVLRTSGTFDYKNERWRIDGLRHLFTPRLSYRYIPEGGKGAGEFPRIDRRARIRGTDYLPYLQPIGLGDIRHIDDLRETNTLRLSFDNLVQTRDRVEGTRDLLAFNVGNDFRFKRAPGERDVSETHAELALMPARWLQIDFYQSITPQNLTLQEFNSGITIRDGRFWSVRFANNFLRRQIEDYLIDGRVRINERLEALSRLRYDARRRRFNEQAYGIVQNLGNTWLVSYTVSLYSGRRRESSFGFNVQIDTVRF
jgi:LPS-assembly protein